MKPFLKLVILAAGVFTGSNSFSAECDSSVIADSLSSFSAIQQQPFSNIIITTNGRSTFPEQEKAKERLEILKDTVPQILDQAVQNGFVCGQSLVDSFKDVLMTERNGRDLVHHFILTGKQDNHNLLSGFIFNIEDVIFAKTLGLPSISSAYEYSRVTFVVNGKEMSRQARLDSTSYYDGDSSTVDFYLYPRLESTSEMIKQSAVDLGNGKQRFTFTFSKDSSNSTLNSEPYFIKPTNRTIKTLKPKKIILASALENYKVLAESTEITEDDSGYSVSVVVDSNMGRKLINVRMTFDAVIDGLDYKEVSLTELFL